MRDNVKGAVISAILIVLMIPAVPATVIVLTAGNKVDALIVISFVITVLWWGALLVSVVHGCDIESSPKDKNESNEYTKFESWEMLR
jgi:hypothetical protein